LAHRIFWRCIICGTQTAERPPRHCPKCGVSAGKFRMMVDREPDPVPPAAVESPVVEPPAPPVEEKKAS
jgi:hypothetical protein